MASYTDIPETLRPAVRADAFVNWLIEQPITYDVRRALAHKWQQHTDTQLLNSHWLQITEAGD